MAVWNHQRIGPYRIWGTIFVLTLLLLFCLPWSKFDTRWSRVAVSNRVHELVKRVESGDEAERALDELVQILKTGNSFQRTTAAVGLGECGPMAASKIPELVAALDSQDHFVSREAARALCDIGINLEQAIPSLRKALKNIYWIDVACYSAEALGKAGKAGVVAIPDLEIAAAQTEDAELARIARESIERIQQDAKRN
jgi:HEAT repeat protein